jgi:hypothetical protein
VELSELHISLHHSFVTQTVHNAFHRSPFSISEAVAFLILTASFAQTSKVGPAPQLPPKRKHQHTYKHSKRLRC